MNYQTLDSLGKIKVGKYTYGHENCEYHYFDEKESGIEIGNFTSIAANVVFVMGGVHRVDTISQYPFGERWPSQKKIDQSYNSYSKGKIKIGSDVYICTGCTILDGVTIGDGAIIGCGSVVTRDVDPYTINFGLPCKFKKYRFDPDTIKILLDTKWWNFEDSVIVAMQKSGVLDSTDINVFKKFLGIGET